MPKMWAVVVDNVESVFYEKRRFGDRHCKLREVRARDGLDKRNLRRPAHRTMINLQQQC